MTIFSGKISVGKRLFAFIIVIAAVAVVYASFFVGKLVQSKENAKILTNFKSIRERASSSQFTEPLLGVHTPESSNGVFKEVRKGVEEIASRYQKENKLKTYGFFYQDLNSSLWFNIHGDDEYLPASLAKLPVALIIERKIEEGELNENQKLTYTYEMAMMKTGQNITALPTELEIGKSYSLKELLVYMLKDSDNVAKDLLSTLVDKESLNSLYELVHFDLPFYGKEISPNQYTFFFKVLYNSTYLSRVHSEFILSTLASSTYRKALVYSLPESVKVSHKYGLYNLTKLNPSNPELELHDCGIVYHSSNPYILCIMTRGSDEVSLDSFIAEVSKYVYDSVDSADGE